MKIYFRITPIQYGCGVEISWRDKDMQTMRNYYLALKNSDLPIIIKIDMVLYVGASLEVMERNCKRMLSERPYIFNSLETVHGVEDIVRFVESEGRMGIS